MTIPLWAIEAAINGGWTGHIGRLATLETTLESWLRYDAPFEWADIIVQPDFWQCLGKELGWVAALCHKHKVGCVLEHECECTDGFVEIAHQFYDLILSRATDDEMAAYWDSLKPKV